MRVEIAPSVRGLATIHDKDVLIYCISQFVAKMKAGEKPQKEMHLMAYDLLVPTNRETSDDGYRRLKEALERLSGTRITTNIKTMGEITEGFGLVDSWRIVRKTDSGRMISVKVSLSDWMYNAVLGHEVLTLHRDYFRLRKPLERRVYEIARKHCGQQDRWSIWLEILQNGSPRPSGGSVDSAAGEGDASEPTLDLGFAARKLGQISRSLICLTGHTRADPSTPDRCGDPFPAKEMRLKLTPARVPLYAQGIGQA